MADTTYEVPRSQVDETEDVDRTEVRSYWQLARRRFVRHRLAVLGAVTLAVLVVAAIVVPLVVGDATGVNISKSFAAPEIVDEEGNLVLAFLGYSRTGINMFTQLMAAAATSLMIGFAAVLIIVFIGVLIGSVAGYAGGWVDNILMRVVDIALSMPGLFIIIAFVAFWGASIWTVILAIGITGWTTAARLVRAEFLSLREADYVQAARALGASPRRIILRHMLPPALAPIIVAASLGVADSVVLEAALSFLGFGIGAEQASLGTLLNVAFEYLNREPYLVLFPSIVLILIVLAANFLGDGMRDALDPRQRVEQQ
ncbi:MAG TPA: ABC transporter permease [Candidatus Limnocylindria bacterium]|nr:ABC transporter permease [Candidatus Limnocylindria bacterium]